MKETDIQKSICEYLARRRHFFWRNNNTSIYDATKKVFRRMPAYSMAGTPDIIVIKDGWFIALEIKQKGGKQSEGQKIFEQKCKEAGGEYYVVKSIEDVQEIGL